MTCPIACSSNDDGCAGFFSAAAIRTNLGLRFEMRTPIIEDPARPAITPFCWPRCEATPAQGKGQGGKGLRKGKGKGGEWWATDASARKSPQGGSGFPFPEWKGDRLPRGTAAHLYS